MAPSLTRNLKRSTVITSDRSNAHHRRCIAASLVQGVYILERDRQQNRQGPQALAPAWWEFFHFQLKHVLVDDNDLSYFGAIYEYKYAHYHYNFSDGQKPPAYVIAFRGTINKQGNRSQDFKLDLQFIRNNLHESYRYRHGLQAVLDITSSRAGAQNIWLAGHSLGSALALLVGRNMVKMGCYLPAYLFNPPFASAPIEKIKNEKLKHGIRIASSVITAGLAVALNGPRPSQEDDAFTRLSSWIPYIFVNPSDPICSEYIGYFEHREKMLSIGAESISKIATRHSIGSLISAAMGKASEALHLLPSAYLTTNISPANDFKQAHGIHQWWGPEIKCTYKLHQYT